MPELLAPLAVSLMIFFCTFVAAVSGMVLRKKLPDDHLGEDSKDVIKLVMGLIATMAALVLGLLIASANSSYETQSGELRQVSATIVELDGILAQYGPEASESRHKLQVAVSAAVDKIWSKDGLRLGQLAPAAVHAEAAGIYDSIAKLSPNTEAQHFIQKRALEISRAIRQTRALMLEQISSSMPWPFLAVLVFWISMLFVGFGLFARANASDRRSLDRSAFGLERDFLDTGIESPLPRLDARLRRAAAQCPGPDRPMSARGHAGSDSGGVTGRALPSNGGAQRGLFLMVERRPSAKPALKLSAPDTKACMGRIGALLALPSNGKRAEYPPSGQSVPSCYSVHKQVHIYAA